jgi:hypothetical protein
MYKNNSRDGRLSNSKMKPVLALIFSMICLLANCQPTGKFNYEILSSGKSYKITPKFQEEPKHF